MIVGGGAIALISFRAMIFRGIGRRTDDCSPIIVALIICAATLLAIVGVFM